MIDFRTLSFVRANWKKLAAVAVVIAVFFAGRASVPDKPARVETVEVVKTVEVEKVVEKKVEVKGEEKRVVVYRDRVVKPDGTRIEHEVERIDTETKTTVAEVQTQERSVDTNRSMDTKVEHRQPEWRVGALVGIDFRADSLSPEVNLWQPQVGVIVERRVLGGLSVGAWGLYSGTVGVAITYEF